MNILQLADFKAPFLGSFGKSQLKLATKSIESGHNYRICFPEKKSWVAEFEKLGQIVDFVPVNGYPTSMNLLRDLSDIIEKHDIDLIHSHFGLEHLLSAAILKKYKYSDLILVHHWRGGPARSNSFKRAFGTYLYKYIGHNLLNMQIANSQAIYKQIVKLGFAKDDHLISLYNGVDTETMSRSNSTNIRAAMGIPENAGMILHVRNFRTAVDFKLIEETFIRIGSLHEDVYFVFVGDGELRESTEERIKLSLIKDRVRFPGIVKNVNDYYLSADVTISSWEPWCEESVNNAVYESLSMETPVVGVDVGALPQMFHEDQGVFVTRPDPERMSNLILDVLSKKNVLVDSLSNARKVVLEHHSIESWSNSILHIYESLSGNDRI